LYCLAEAINYGKQITINEQLEHYEKEAKKTVHISYRRRFAAAGRKAR